MLLQSIKDSTEVLCAIKKEDTVMYLTSEQLSLENQVSVNVYSTYSEMILIHILGSYSNL